MMSQIMGIDSLLHDLACFYIFQKKIPLISFVSLPSHLYVLSPKRS